MKQLRKQKGIGARALEFGMLTAARTAEITGAVWGEFDIQAHTWTVPADRMKGGEQHLVHLTPRAVEIIESMRIALESRGYHVLVARDGNQGLAMAEREDPDLMILDMMMPKRSGFLVMEKLRRSRPVPEAPTAPSPVRAGDVEIDVGARKVTRAGSLVHLTPTEFALLREFATNPGVLLTHATLLRRVWGHGYETQTEYTRVYMARLRAKLEDPDGPPLFVTEPRSGYRFVAD